MLGTAEFLQRNHLEALRAWNHAGEPLNDLVRVDGLARTRYRVVADRLGIAPGDILTPARFERAERRLTELPASSVSRLEVAPIGGGLAEVRAAVLERPSMPISRNALAVPGGPSVGDPRGNVAGVESKRGRRTARPLRPLVGSAAGRWRSVERASEQSSSPRHSSD